MPNGLRAETKRRFHYHQSENVLRRNIVGEGGAPTLLTIWIIMTNNHEHRYKQTSPTPLKQEHLDTWIPETHQRSVQFCWDDDPHVSLQLQLQQFFHVNTIKSSTRWSHQGAHAWIGGNKCVLSRKKHSTFVQRTYSAPWGGRNI